MNNASEFSHNITLKPKVDEDYVPEPYHPKDIEVVLSPDVNNVCIVASEQNIVVNRGCSIQGMLYIKSSSGSINLDVSIPHNITIVKQNILMIFISSAFSFIYIKGDLSAKEIILTTGTGPIKMAKLNDISIIKLSTMEGLVHVNDLLNVHTLSILNSTGDIYIDRAYVYNLDTYNANGITDIQVRHSNTIKMVDALQLHKCIY